MRTKKTPAKSVREKRPSVGERIVECLEEAIGWSKGDGVPVRVTEVQIPDINVSQIRHRMGLSQAQFAMKFGFSPATLRNWEQGRVRLDASARVLLAVIAKHPESVEDALKDAQ